MGKVIHDQVSNEKRAPGWLGDIGDERLPSFYVHPYLGK